ncbi:MAG: CaiB/BaiF CoA transferase family protein [Actinocrinis sp.]
MSPLNGLRVVELAAIGPVPYAAMLLADLGAEVVRIDRADGERPFAAWHRGLDRGRRIVRLDLKQPDGLAELLRIVEHGDVLLEGFRPGVAERLGFGPDACHARNRALVYGRMTGWGQRGPLAQTPGHDINFLALSGALDAIGPEGGDPVVPLNLVGDFAGGALPLALGVLAALLERRTTGIGRVIDAAIVDGTASLLTMLTAMSAAGLWDRGRGRNLLDGGAPFYTVYTCADGRHIAVGALEERFYLAFVRGLGLDPAQLPDRDDPERWPALRRVFALRIAQADRDTWAAGFEGTDACVTPVLSLAEAADHPHHRARGTYRDESGLRLPAAVPRFVHSVGEP